MRLLPFLPFLLAAPASAADLTSLASSAVLRSPAVAEASARRAQADAALRESNWSRLPRLSADAALTRSDDPLFAFGSLLQQRRVAAADFSPDTLNRPHYRSSIESGLTLGMPLFTGFEFTRAAQSAALSGREADAGRNAASQFARLRVVSAYVSLLADAALLAELGDRVSAADAEVVAAEKLRKQGLILGSDHQAALAILAGLRARRARAAAERSAHEAELSILVGTPVVKIAGSLPSWSPSIGTDEELVSEALAGRSDLRIADLRRDQARIRERRADSSLLPVIDAFAAVRTNDDGWGGNSAARFVGLRASLPFGDPAYLSRREKSRADADAADAARRSLEDSARMEVASRAAGLRGLVSAAADMEEALARSRKSLDEVRPLHREGRQSILEVLRAEASVAEMTESLLDLRRRIRVEWASLRAAQGRLDEEAIAAISRGLQEAQ